LTGDAGLSRALARDYREADLTAADRGMLDYAVKLTRQPAEVGEEDVDRLRALGFEDRAILDICQVAAYYNYVNRLADGAGVELEPHWTEEEMTVTHDEWAAREAGDAPGEASGE